MRVGESEHVRESVGKEKRVRDLRESERVRWGPDERARRSERVRGIRERWK